MRIEVLVDVKTTLGEGPLWDVERAAALLDRQFRRPRLPRHRRRPRDPRLGRAAEDRLDGAAQERRRRRRLAARGFHFLDFKTGDVDADPRSRARQAEQPASTTARSTSAAASSPARWTRWRKARTARSTASTPTSPVTKLDGGIIVSQRPVLESGRRDLLFRRFLVGRDLGLRLRPRHRRRLQPAHLRQDRHLERRRRRRLDGRCRGLSLERAGL